MPLGWNIGLEEGSGPDHDRAWFEGKDGPRTWVHPKLGPLPDPWILKLVSDRKNCEMLYYNYKTKETTSKDPRFHRKTLAANAKAVPKELRIAASAQKNSAGLDPSKMRRAPIGDKDIRDHYDIVHTIDAGDGKKGGMNGGVFVVRIRGADNRLYIEKRFKEDQVPLARKEIEITRKLNHAALMSYSYAFIIDKPIPLTASIYVEFCDRGDLDGVIREYAKHKGERPPEAFIWHAFGGLLDGLAYLQTGVGHLHNKNIKRPHKWTPILHRDMKPDNVLLRSRMTVGSGKYFYCVLSDFGLATEDQHPSDKLCDPSQTSGRKCGTMAYLAPEQCYDPYPKTEDENKYFPKGRNGQRMGHSRKTDVWALGATIFNLMECEGITGHLDFSKRPSGLDSQTWYEGQLARRRKYPLVPPMEYSAELRELIYDATRWDPENRPDAVELVKKFEKLQRKSGFDTQRDAPPLPDWATREHAYFAK
jgi:NIMA (never in mitosis gene a)-related kinase